ncbi:MAG: alkene reductase [Balneolaceae bacterium]|nr:alkene reductase [Balneolaceae bacterium]
MLFTEFSLNNLSLKNRMVMAPMTRSRANQEHVPTDIMATYYRQRSGAGLIITEGVGPSPNGVGYPRIPGVYNDEQTKGWKKVTEEVHENDGKIFMQLMHTGRVSHPLNLPENGKVLAPSAVQLEDEQMYTDQEGLQDYPTPQVMSLNQIESTIKEYVNAAERAIEAGFDGVELHGANGYLIEQFLSPNTNLREDEYGGSIENRNRFALEVAKAVTNAIGENKTGIRLSPYGVFNGIKPHQELEAQYEQLAKSLNELGLSYIHIVDHSAMGAPEVPLEIKQIIRDAFSDGAIILSGGYTSEEQANEDLESGLGDLIAFGRPFISNPDLPYRLKNDIELADPNPDTFYTPGPEGYTDYPEAEVLEHA